MCSRRLLVVSALVGVILGMESRRGSAEKAQPAAVPHVAPNTAANHAPATPTAVRQPLLVDLLRYGARVEVSSQVRNDKFSAAGLVDGRPATVWNSQTGRLVGEWIEVTLPAEVRLREIQLIVGNTAPGRKGQDWFAMNPRIKAASVWVDGRKRGVVKFDTNLRSPQPLSVDVAEATTVRIVVDEVVMGTKRDWKEVCVGDLIVRGESNGRARPLAVNLQAACHVVGSLAAIWLARIWWRRVARDAATVEHGRDEAGAGAQPLAVVSVASVAAVVAAIAAYQYTFAIAVAVARGLWVGFFVATLALWLSGRSEKK